MPDLKIEIVARNELGSIVALITPDGVVDAKTASREIASGDAIYVTGPDSYVRVPVRAISATGGAYLYANWDGSRRNNLHDLATVNVLTLSTLSTRNANPALGTRTPTLRMRAAALWERLVPRIRPLTPLPTPATACVDCA